MSKDSINIKELKNNVVVIRIGENLLGGNDALDFSSKLMELNQKNIEHVIVDLQNVKLINSSGIGMLVSGLTTLKKNDASMILVGLSEKIIKILKMTHLDQVFITYDNVDKALENIR
ncbi:MAG: STAS domain-containing protein [bacterium]